MIRGLLLESGEQTNPSARTTRWRLASNAVNDLQMQFVDSQMPAGRRNAPSAPFFIGITGGSGSGKTTLAKLIPKLIGPKRSSLLIGEDDYYIDQTAKPKLELTDFNFDDIEAHDHDLLIKDVLLLKKRLPIRMPQYDFATHKRVAQIDKQPSDIVIIEGIHCLYDLRLRNLLDYKIYLDVPDDIRLLRRIKRDLSERGRTLDETISNYLQFVRPMHYLYTYPTRRFADLVVEPKLNAMTLRDSEDEMISALQPLLLHLC